MGESHVQNLKLLLLCFLHYSSISQNELSLKPHNLTLASTGGGGWCNPPPLRFFADSEKTAALSAAGFWATLWGKHCAIFGKKKLTGSGQVTEL